MNLRPLAALAVTALIGIGSSATPASAQEYQGCFLLDESRVFRDLSFMCSRPVPTISNRVTTSGSSTNSAFTPSRGQNGFATPYRVQDTATALDRRALIVMAASILLEGPISLVTAE